MIIIFFSISIVISFEEKNVLKENIPLSEKNELLFFPDFHLCINISLFIALLYESFEWFDCDFAIVLLIAINFSFISFFYF